MFFKIFSSEAAKIGKRRRIKEPSQGPTKEKRKINIKDLDRTEIGNRN